MVSGRPDWCISRQRAWGVPIPALDCTKCGEAVLTGAIVEQAATVFDEYGADAWYERPIEEFVPSGLTCQKCGGATFERENNILDVWFDSGSSHEAVLPFRPELTWPADLYLEGSDQHRGWFQSSLLIGLGTRGAPPFRAVLTHGFFVDEEGRKMSKSLGNTIEPQEIIAKSGAEIIRLWVAMVDYREEIRIGKEILARVVEAYRKLRNTVRILAANLFDFDPSRDLVATSALEPVDRYILSRYATLALKVRASYDAFDFQGAVHGLSAFATVDLSAFYVDVSKDRLYTLAAGSPSRRAAQTAMFHIVDGLARLVAPILPVTAEQLWKALPGTRDVVGAPGRVPRGGLARGAGRRRAGRRVATAAGDPGPGQRRDRRAPQREAVWHFAGRARDAHRVWRRPGAAATLRGRPADAVHRLRGDADRRRRRRSGRRRDEGRRREVRALLAHRPVGDARGRSRRPVRAMRGRVGRAGGAVNRRLELAVVAFIAVLDQLTKLLVVARMELYETIPVVPGLLNLTHIRNSGVAFGLFNAAEFSYKPVVMALVALLALVGVGLYAAQLPASHRWARGGLALILGGAAGNLVDRARQGYVVDFVDAYWNGWHFWAFNVADAAISVGVGLLIIDLFRSEAAAPPAVEEPRVS